MSKAPKSPSARELHAMEETHAAEGDATSPDGLVVAILGGAGQGRSARVPAEIGGSIRVGKSSTNELVVPDDTVSRHHLTFTRTREGLHLKDEGSRNGTRIGGAKVQEAIVEPGAVIRAGEVELIVRVDTDGVSIAPSDEPSFGVAIGTSLAMRRIFSLLRRISPTGATVLLTGETGTGKDVLARSIHAESARSKGPFEVVDCGAVTPNLIESELFGHERGAFTGAVNARAGAFERASANGGGTLFLDEVGELPLELQPKLLRVLEAREFRRVGGNKTLKSEARIVAATMRDLRAEVRAGRFREDLYFRLAVVPIEVPPLRSRLDDLPMLVRRILDASDEGKDLRVSAGAMARLRTHRWNGNVRELRNALERAAYLARGSSEAELREIDLDTGSSPPAPIGESAGDPFVFDAGVSYRDARARIDALFERRFVAWLLGRHGGNVSAAARDAQMDRKHLGDLAKKHGIAGKWEA